VAERDVWRDLWSRFQRPPFTYQSTHAESLESAATAIANGDAAITPTNLERWIEETGATLDAHPADWLLRQQLAFLLQSAGRYDEAVDQWLQIVDQVPHETTLTQLGAAQNRARQFADARRALQRAIDLNPMLPRAFNSLGIALSHLEDFGGSYAAFAQAVALRPSFAEAYLNWALVLANRGEDGEAAARFRDAVEADPGGGHAANAHHRLGQMLLEKGDSAAARPHYEAVSKLQPKNPSAHLNLAFLCLRLGDQGAARKSLSRVLELDPDNTMARDALRKVE
jgi:tetratricopeptide (TPR) repeat protein